MKKILFSWLATINDFEDSGIINTTGPTLNIHAHHWYFDQHIILYTADYEQKALEMLRYLEKNFSNHRTNISLLDLNRVYIDFLPIKSKVESLLLDYSDFKIYLLLSTGTGLMKIAWYIAHTTLNLKTHLLQVLSPADSQDSLVPDMFEIEVEHSKIPVTAMIREKNLSQKHKKTDFLLSKSLEKVYNRAEKIAQSDNVSVLILGNTGTGKEVLAKYIHQRSARKHKPFLTVNCSAFSGQLLESRLFGHKKGSFTGAYSDSKGIFEQAKGGTVFLDEIGDINSYMQQALLRFLQNKEIQPIGKGPKKVDVRVIAATNKNIRQLIENNKFRADLFYRLGIILFLPDLKDFSVSEKKEWIDFFLKKKRDEFSRKRVLKLDPYLKDFLIKYKYPGNIRELINIVDNLYVFVENKAKIDDLPLYLEKFAPKTSLKLKDVEREHIIRVYKLSEFNKSKTAKNLGIALNTLKSKLKHYKIID